MPTCAQFTHNTLFQAIFAKILWIHERIETSKADWNAFLLNVVDVVWYAPCCRKKQKSLSMNPVDLKVEIL